MLLCLVALTEASLVGKHLRGLKREREGTDGRRQVCN